MCVLPRKDQMLTIIDGNSLGAVCDHQLPAQACPWADYGTPAPVPRPTRRPSQSFISVWYQRSCPPSSNYTLSSPTCSKACEYTPALQNFNLDALHTFMSYTVTPNFIRMAMLLL